MEKDNIIRNKTFDFALKIIAIYKCLNEKKEFVLSKQILRSGTSIGANVEEADAAISKAEFSSKISIAYKESRETIYWLKLLYHSSYLDQETFHATYQDCTEICKILFATLKSSGRIRKNS